MIADNVRREGSNVPGFGPLRKGNATFGADGRYSFEVTPSTGNQQGISASGTYTLDEAGKALSLKVERARSPIGTGPRRTPLSSFQTITWDGARTLSLTDERDAHKKIPSSPLERASAHPNSLCAGSGGAGPTQILNVRQEGGLHAFPSTSRSRHRSSDGC
jgi:hypothetical protein